MPRRRWDGTAIFLHGVALLVWAPVVGWMVYRNLLERFPAGDTRPNPDRRSSR